MNANTAINGEAHLKLGPVFGDRVFLLLGADLLCLDSVTGEQIWRTTTKLNGLSLVVAPRAESIDGETSELFQVGVVSEKQQVIGWYDALDGQPVRQDQLPDGEVQASQGRFLLHVNRADQTTIDENDEIADPYLVQLLDATTMQPVQSRIVSSANRTDMARSSTYAELIESRYFTLVDNQGETTIWDIATGQSIAEVTIPVRESLFGLSMMHLDGSFVILPRARLPVANASPTTNVFVSGNQGVKGASSVHVIDQATGQVTWSQPFEETWGVTVHQPWHTPMLMFARGRAKFATNATRRRELDILGLSTEDGSKLEELIGKQVGLKNNVIETQTRLLPAQDKIIVILQGEILTFTFGVNQDEELTE